MLCSTREGGEGGKEWRAKEKKVVTKQAYFTRKIIWKTVVDLGIHLQVRNGKAAEWLHEYQRKKGGPEVFSLAKMRDWVKPFIAGAKGSRSFGPWVVRDLQAAGVVLVCLPQDRRDTAEISDVDLCEEVLV